MAVLATNLDVRSEIFRTNAAAMRRLVDDLRDKAGQILRGGPERARERHRARGKLLARDRIDALIDAGSPLLEVGQLAAYGMYGENIP